MNSLEKVRTEFDEAAVALHARGVRHNEVLSQRKFLNAYLPARAEFALDIGCGLGDYVRFLARRSNHALGLDLSPEMIRIARERSADVPNAEFQVADVTAYEFPPNRYDIVASFNTLHHIPLEPILEKIKHTLKPGGVFINFDICEQSGPVNAIFAAFNRIRRSAKSRLQRLMGKRPRRGVDGKNMHHDPDETYPKFAAVKPIYQRFMPGAKAREHIGMGRYSVVWKKP